MKIIHAANELKPGSRKVCLAIGVFDGVHLGHQQIIRQTVADAHQHDAIALVITFDRHPNTVVAPDRVPPLIYSLPQKLGAIESLGADTLLLIHFDENSAGRRARISFAVWRATSEKSKASVSARILFLATNAAATSRCSKNSAANSGFTVHGLAAVSLDNQIVSSTRIREAIRSGNLDAASQMLGRPYAISGRVIEGDGVGRNSVFRPRISTRRAWFCRPTAFTLGARPKSEEKPQTASRSNIGFRRRWRPAGRSFASRRTCLISPATFTARNWKSKSAKSSATSRNLVRSKN